jgi:hypothetical protein
MYRYHVTSRLEIRMRLAQVPGDYETLPVMVSFSGMPLSRISFTPLGPNSKLNPSKERPENERKAHLRAAQNILHWMAVR